MLRLYSSVFQCRGCGIDPRVDQSFSAHGNRTHWYSQFVQHATCVGLVTACKDIRQASLGNDSLQSSDDNGLEMLFRRAASLELIRGADAMTRKIFHLLIRTCIFHSTHRIFFISSSFESKQKYGFWQRAELSVIDDRIYFYNNNYLL